MNNIVEKQTRRVQLHTYVAEALPRLAEMKKQGDRSGFNKLMMKLLPGVRQYIGRRLKRAIKNGDLPAGKFKVADFADELFVQAYDHLQEVSEDKDLHQWLFKKADELLEDTLIEEDFDNTFFDNIDDYGEEEWEAMQERFTTDADGDLVMEEELDDPSYPKYDYVLADVFVENSEDALLDKISRELSADEIHQHIDMMLQQMPSMMQTVFELAVNDQFKPREIASIKQISVREVEQYIGEARERIRLSFQSRYTFR
jgi:RNA polymerase sigma factor (sigma-70 family)